MYSYCDRQWLNDNNSASTGSVVAFHGETTWRDKPEVTMFLELADCHNKVRLHKSYDDTQAMFIDKLNKLATVVSNFAIFLSIMDDYQLINARKDPMFEECVVALLAAHTATPFKSDRELVQWWRGQYGSRFPVYDISQIALHVRK
jgi:hypothetical protein